MLKGLEINIVTLNNSLKNLEFNGRIESEFFQTEYTKLLEILAKKPIKKLGQIAFITDGEHGNPKTFPTGFAKYFGARNVLDGILNDNNVDYITEEHHKSLRKSALKPNDILISCVGANIGFAAIVPDEIGNANIVRNVALIRSTSSEYSNQYLLAYFQSYFGKNLYFRLATGNAQPLVSLDYIKTIPVFKASDNLQKEITKLIEKAKSNRKSAAQLFDNALNELLDNLNFSGWHPSNENTAIKKLSNVFSFSGRLDAEYYQIKYDEIEAKIKSYQNGWKDFSDCITISDKNFNPVSDKEYRYIELADIGNSGEITGCSEEVGVNLPSRARRIVKTNDVIVSSIEGSLTKCALVTEQYDKALCSTGFYVIKSKEILSEVLLLIFKSAPFQELMKKRCSGTILTAISSDELKTIPIPILPMDTQKELVKQIKQSFKLRQESTKLIDIAKQAVEIAIEQNEQTAMKFIKDNT